MQKFIRASVFETNSSSSHSLTLSDAPLRDFSCVRGALESGKMRVTIRDHFGWEWKRLHKPENKIAYLLSQVASNEMDRLCGKGDVASSLRGESDTADFLLERRKRYR